MLTALLVLQMASNHMGEFPCVRRIYSSLCKVPISEEGMQATLRWWRACCRSCSSRYDCSRRSSAGRALNSCAGRTCSCRGCLVQPARARHCPPAGSAQQAAQGRWPVRLPNSFQSQRMSHILTTPCLAQLPVLQQQARQRAPHARACQEVRSSASQPQTQSLAPTGVHRCQGTNVSAFSLAPGTILTPITRHTLLSNQLVDAFLHVVTWPFLKSVEQACCLGHCCMAELLLLPQAASADRQLSSCSALLAT